LKSKEDSKTAAHAEAVRQMVDPQFEQQLKAYEQAVQQFHQQKYGKAKEVLEKVQSGPSKELADRAQVHLRIIDQRLAKQPAPSLRTPEDHYQAGVAMMNLGRWDEARDHLLRARKMAPKADYVFYAMAALDCLTGEAESAMENLKVAIQLRPENRYHARNDEDFAFLQEDPRFTELLYPEREASGV
jgi:tetratricopeptide (TPR) repeat protein